MKGLLRPALASFKHFPFPHSSHIRIATTRDSATADHSGPSASTRFSTPTPNILIHLIDRTVGIAINRYSRQHRQNAGTYCSRRALLTNLSPCFRQFWEPGDIANAAIFRGIPERRAEAWGGEGSPTTAITITSEQCADSRFLQYRATRLSARSRSSPRRRSRTARFLNGFVSVPVTPSGTYCHLLSPLSISELGGWLDLPGRLLLARTVGSWEEKDDTNDHKR